MQKSDLFDLILAVRVILSDDLPIIVGSQATHALSEVPPEVALESVECDFLVFGGNAEARDRINEDLGVFSQFQRQRGYYADALGLATAIIPSGWQVRLQPLVGPDGDIVANCIEVHDLAVSKLIAGREKDLEFLQDAIFSGLISVSTFLERIVLVASQVENDTISDRISRLIYVLKRNDVGHQVIDVMTRFIESH